MTGAVEAPQSAGLPTKDKPSDHWVLPAIRGFQARHEYYVVLVKRRELPRRLAPIDAGGPPELGQRALNNARVPKIAECILGNPNDYIFSSLVASSTGSHDDLDQAAELAGSRWETPLESPGLGCSALKAGAPERRALQVERHDA
ncbi:DNA sulfur modification protein DndB [Sorangium sp. So ce233]|uniref:DNA sulfur modification protein DndB n=1 Tax=Sorangium sp. So ce233 TaxID=3133290 RepID=UPI003F61F59F